MLGTREVTEELRLLNGEPWERAPVRVLLWPGTYVDGTTYPGREGVHRSDADGVVTFAAVVITEGDVPLSRYTFEYPDGFAFTRELGPGGPTTLSALRAGAP